MKKNILSFILLLLNTLTLTAQSETDSTETKNFGVFGYPYAFYSPETDLAFGLGGMMYFRLDKTPEVELSNTVVSGYYTVNTNLQ